jgi:hypothetical protein
VEHLSGFDIAECLDGLQFDNDVFVTDKISAVGCVEGLALVEDANGVFPDERNGPFCQLQLDGVLLDGFEETRPELPVYLHCCADDGISLGVFL